MTKPAETPLYSITPYTKNYVNDTQLKATMVHELGHVLCLGHPDTLYNITSVKSIMRSTAVSDFYVPQSHDKNDINSKY